MPSAAVLHAFDVILEHRIEHAVHVVAERAGRAARAARCEHGAALGGVDRVAGDRIATRHVPRLPGRAGTSGRARRFFERSGDFTGSPCDRRHRADRSRGDGVRQWRWSRRPRSRSQAAAHFMPSIILSSSTTSAAKARMPSASFSVADRIVVERVAEPRLVERDRMLHGTARGLGGRARAAADGGLQLDHQLGPTVSKSQPASAWIWPTLPESSHP